MTDFNACGRVSGNSGSGSLSAAVNKGIDKAVGHIEYQIAQQHLDAADKLLQSARDKQLEKQFKKRLKEPIRPFDI